MIPVLIVSSFFGALLISIGLNWLALIPWRRSAGAHWTERARLLFPARTAARVNLILLTIVSSIATSIIAPQLNPIFTVLPVFFGALLAGFFLNREIFPAMTFMQWLQFIVAIWFFLSPVLVFGVAAFVMPGNFGLTTWIIAASEIVLLLSLQFGLNVRLLRYLRIFRPAPDRLTKLVQDVSGKMSIVAPATWIVEAPMSNAAALPGPRQLVFTEKLLATHSDDEIKAICAHELGHLTEPEKVRLSRLLLPLFIFPLAFLRPIDSVMGPALNEFAPGAASNAFLCSILIVFIPIVFCFIFAKRLGRRMEKRADQVAVKHQESPAVYARALERLYQTNQSPAVMPRRMRPSVHPDLYDRMLAAGITPDYPKPAPPAKLCWSTFVLVGICCLPGVAYALIVAHNAFMARLQQ
jgi:Zn-dependent protease with chaperone function